MYLLLLSFQYLKIGQVYNFHERFKSNLTFYTVWNTGKTGHMNLHWNKQTSNLTNLTIHSEKTHFWLNYWHTLISKDTSGFTSNSLLIKIQYWFISGNVKAVV